MTITRLPDLVRFLALHATIGFAVAAVFVFGLIELNPNDIGTLLAHADGYPLPTLVLWFMLGLTASSCQMGAAIMLLGSSSGDDGDRGKRQFPLITALHAPVLAKARTAPRG